MHQSVPLVPWNCQQASVCKDVKFLQLMHKLGFHMPIDTGKVFIRIPHFWTPDFLFSVAGKVLAIDMCKFQIPKFKQGIRGLIISFSTLVYSYLRTRTSIDVTVKCPWSPKHDIMFNVV